MIDLQKKQEILQNFKLLTDYLSEIPAFTSCLDCEHWDHKGDKCVKFGTKPPAKVIVHKCSSFEIDIPF